MNHIASGSISAPPGAGTPPGGKKRRARRLARAAVVLLVVWPVVAWLGARALVVRADAPRADCIVVLSGARDYVERTRYAAELWRSGVAPKIVLTNDNLRGGWNSEQQRNPYFIEREAEELRRAGVPEAQIEALPEPVAGTYDEAVRLRAYATAAGVGSMVVVTSAYHSRRAAWTMRRVFRESGVRVGVAPVAAGAQTPTAFTWWLSARGWRSVAPEYPKLVYYRLRYG